MLIMIWEAKPNEACYSQCKSQIGRMAYFSLRSAFGINKLTVHPKGCPTSSMTCAVSKCQIQVKECRIFDVPLTSNMNRLSGKQEQDCIMRWWYHLMGTPSESMILGRQTDMNSGIACYHHDFHSYYLYDLPSSCRIPSPSLERYLRSN